ncbi:MAG: glycerol kinase GlpK [Gemmatimonadetes bacterium]|nr:glycerol kinase GlpK [Gemmatimonadota bacterium]MCH8935517.1 glycerol kinase GlpK [Gemmatimonadota bacterium]MCH8937983.1 glycerol kinase GlpK [Gemmatimonadota bacterium]
MKSVLAIDQGTTGTTCMVFAQDGEVLGRGYREFTQHFPQPGWVEHDAEEIWQRTLDAGRDALRQAGTTPSAVGITNQRETIVAWDRHTGQPLHRALVWQDRRTAQRCRELEEELGADYVTRRTGLVWDPYFSATKIEWLCRNVPGLRDRVAGGDAVFGTIDAWLVFRLTSGVSFVTDHSNASRTLLYNIDRREWDTDLLTLFDVPVTALPEVRRSSEVVGLVDGTHLGFEAPIAGIAGDQQAALYGQGCWESGQAKCTYGTGAFLLMNVGDRPDAGRPAGGMLTTIGCDAGGAPVFALEGSIFIAGAAVQWLRDGLRIIESAGDTEAMARAVQDTGGVYFVPAFVGMGAPHWEAEARGTIVGLTRGTTREHLVRAALEAMAYGTRDVAQAMTEASGIELKVMKVDGGAAANDWLMQYQADVLGVKVARPDLVETTALGVAGLAGLATGVWRSPEQFAASRTYRYFEPAAGRDGEYRGWQRAVDAALHWARNR